MAGIKNVFWLFIIFLVLAFLPLHIWFLLLIPYFVLVFRGSDSRKEKLINKIRSNLTGDEQLEIIAVELRIFALFHRRYAVCVTNNRVICIRPKILGGFRPMEEWQWKYMTEVLIEENSFPSIQGSNLAYIFSSDTPNNDRSFSISGLNSSDASKIYNFSNSQKQQWAEKNRIRRMEEARAASGGMNFMPSQHAGSTPPMVGGSVIENKLREAKSLLDNGLISNAEYQERKSKILSEHI